MTKKGPQARSFERGDSLWHSFYVVVADGGKHVTEYGSYKDATAFLEAYDAVPEADRCF